MTSSWTISSRPRTAASSMRRDRASPTSSPLTSTLGRFVGTPIEGLRADHSAISPTGTTLLLSATTVRKVHAIDTTTGRITGSFDSGDEPHENNFSEDGRLIFHASIGRIFLPIRSKLLRRLKRDRWLQVVDSETMTVLKRIDMGSSVLRARCPAMRQSSAETHLPRRLYRLDQNRTGQREVRTGVTATCPSARRIAWP
jgi:hypothetical protein